MPVRVRPPRVQAAVAGTGSGGSAASGRGTGGAGTKGAALAEAALATISAAARGRRASCLAARRQPTRRRRLVFRDLMEVPPSPRLQGSWTLERRPLRARVRFLGLRGSTAASAITSSRFHHRLGRGHDHFLCDDGGPCYHVYSFHHRLRRGHDHFLNDDGGLGYHFRRFHHRFGRGHDHFLCDDGGLGYRLGGFDRGLRRGHDHFFCRRRRPRLSPRQIPPAPQARAR